MNHMIQTSHENFKTGDILRNIGSWDREEQWNLPNIGVVVQGITELGYLVQSFVWIEEFVVSGPHTRIPMTSLLKAPDLQFVKINELSDIQKLVHGMT